MLLIDAYHHNVFESRLDRVWLSNSTVRHLNTHPLKGGLSIVCTVLSIVCRRQTPTGKHLDNIIPILPSCIGQWGSSVLVNDIGPHSAIFGEWILSD
eukprot:m.10149 g.10149  ORF g.10149 m.10149 type:complete len:97 (-) comp4278_c0_seq1:49-339(-)